MKLPHLKSGTPTLAYAGELQQAFDHYNAQLFDGRLPPCLMTLQRTARTFGYFSHQRFLSAKNGVATDEIAINPQYLANFPPLEAMQTVVHEMCHMWQYHFGKPSKRSYHNKEWADKMEAVGLMPSSTGRPGGARTGEKIADYPIEGGRFLQATRQLFSEGPFLTWYDRFSAPGRSRPGIASQAMSVSIAGAAMFAEEAEDEDQDDVEHGAPIGIILDLPNWLTSAPSASDTTLAASLTVREDGQGGQRHKYRCQACSINVWGKGGLKIVCGECGHPFACDQKGAGHEEQ
ncbi:SprT-like domain-containing protein [Stenotrophomonas sp. GD03993]|uniref:SprT-like domain-containing protein n=1 Tax=unclassified Stenotrophomonas TaxID=196198 RepID=UPI002446A7AD|nr:MULTISPECIES: SprT-like domain-containing protein [unclassified Stenotrophomonas]MDH0190268.1 SprT-like domain-containing protein [Stenotrophomonas sp. GD04051]MDH0465329.1 SprT-like domain-containing protein [Stenotrophomonas sp. GD03993]MDH0877826.1 SprT-like domain-containing protein [Stenotrophomonas sp. GD03877]